MVYIPIGVVALVLIAPITGSNAMPVPRPLTIVTSEFAGVAGTPLTVSLARMLASAVGAATPAGTVADSVTGFGGSIIVPTPVTPLIFSAVVSEVSTVLSTIVGYDTVKLVTPVGTVSTPAISVTPLEKTGVATKSVPAVAVVPVNVNGYEVGDAIGVLRVTVWINCPPSSTVALPTVTDAAAVLSMMLPVPVAVPIVAPLPVTAPMVAVKFSVGSPGIASAIVGTLKFAVVWPARIVTVTAVCAV